MRNLLWMTPALCLALMPMAGCKISGEIRDNFIAKHKRLVAKDTKVFVVQESRLPALASFVDTAKTVCATSPGDAHAKVEALIAKQAALEAEAKAIKEGIDSRLAALDAIPTALTRSKLKALEQETEAARAATQKQTSDLADGVRSFPAVSAALQNECQNAQRDQTSAFATDEEGHGH